MKVIKLMMVPIIVMQLTACATKQTYEGKELPPEQVALIKESDQFEVSTVIYEVDGKALGFPRFGATKVTVLPGEHRIKFRINSGIIRVYSAYVTLTMHAEAGHTYQLDGKIHEGKNVYAWITDETTGNIVAGSKYGEDATSYADSAYKASPITTLGEYKHDNRYAIHQNIDTLSRKLWKSKTQKIVRTTKTNTFRKNDVLELIDLNGDNYPEKYAYWGKGRSRNETKDFGFIYDLNNDAKIDYIVFYQGAMIGEDEANSFMLVFTFYHWIDTNYDGIVDTWVYPDVDLDGNGKIELGTYAWLYDTNNDGIIDAGEYLSKDAVKSIDAENNVYKLKLMTGEGSREGIQKLTNNILTDINSIIQ